MITLLLSIQFILILTSLFVGLIVILIIRSRTAAKVEQGKPVGLWVRAICLSVDITVVEFFAIIFSYSGNLRVASHINFLLLFSYFFFFWLFFGRTPAKMLAGIRILPSKEYRSLNLLEIIKRLGGYLILFIGWIPLFWDKNEKKAIHDYFARTNVVYTRKDIQPQEEKSRQLSFILLGIVAVFLISLLIFGFGEKISKFAETDHLKFIDINQDEIIDGIMIDSDKNKEADVMKYDIDNDGILDLGLYDLTGDGKVDAIDINNDGRLDGYDLNFDGELDKKNLGGYIFIWLWDAWFILLGLGFIGVIIYSIFLGRKKTL